MGFFDTEDNTAVMPFTLLLLKAFGCRGTRWDFLRFQFAVFWMCLITMIPKAFLGYRDSISFIRGMSEFIFQANACIKLVIVAAKRDEFERMLTTWQKWFRKTFEADGVSKQSMVLARCNRVNDLFAKGYFTYCTTVVHFYIISPLIQSTIIYQKYNQKNNTEPIELIAQMEQEFYGLDIRSNLVHYGFYTICAIPSYWFAAYMLIVDICLVFCCCKCCSTLLEVVSIRLRNLTTIKGDKQKEELKDIIEMHIDVLRCVELLNETRHFPLLVQIVNCVLMWCMMAVYLTMNFNANAVNILVLFIVLTIETYGVCVLGSELSQKNVDLQRTIYDFPWYNAPVEMQKSLQQMLQRSQKHVGINAAGFCYVDIEQFGKLAQTSYQIFVVMKDTL